MPTREPYLTRKYKYDTQIAHIKKWGGDRLTQSEHNRLFILRDSLEKDAELRNSNSAPTQTYLDRLDYLKLAQERMKENLAKESSAPSMWSTEKEQDKRLKVLQIQLESVEKEILLCRENIAKSQETPPVIDDVSLRNARITNLYAGGYISKAQLQEVNRKGSDLKIFISDPKVYNLLIQEPIKFSMNVVMECSLEERSRILRCNEVRMLGVVESLPEEREEKVERNERAFYRRQGEIAEEQRAAAKAASTVPSVIKPVQEVIVELNKTLNNGGMEKEKNIVVNCVKGLGTSVASFLGSGKDKQAVVQLKSECKEHASKAIIGLGKDRPIVTRTLTKLFNWAVDKVAAKVDNALKKLGPPPEADNDQKKTLSDPRS